MKPAQDRALKVLGLARPVAGTLPLIQGHPRDFRLTSETAAPPAPRNANTPGGWHGPNPTPERLLTRFKPQKRLNEFWKLV